MMRKEINQLLFLLLVLIVVTGTEIAAVSLKDNISSKNAIRVVIVPGHDPGAGGAAFRDYYERDLVSQIAEYVGENLRDCSVIEPFITRDKDGWNQTLESYLSSNGARIEGFINDVKNIYQLRLDKGTIEYQSSIRNGGIDLEQARTMFGLNMWLNEKKQI